MNELAIVIPAHQNIYLDSVFTCLAQQTNRNFNVYVGDDCSITDLSNTVKKYNNDLKIFYKRFDSNLGQEDLVEQWNRSVRLSNEKWVWLFSDDDMADNRCVEYFYNALEATEEKFSIYRFNTILIDKNDEIVDISPPHAMVENPMEYALYRLQSNRHGCISNIIFSRDSFEKEDGFIKLPMAWYADDASIIAFSGEHGIYTISGPRVKYRISWGKNVSSQKSFKKIDALFEYRDWLNNRFINYKHNTLGLDLPLMNVTIKKWFLRNFVSLGGIPFLKILLISRRLDKIFDNGLSKNIFLIVSINVYTAFRSIFGLNRL